MKRALAVAAVVPGVVLLLFGLLFLVGSAGKGRRLAVAAVSLAAGAVLAGLGLRTWRRADAESPERLRADILALAKERNGEVAMTGVAARLGDRLAAARPVIETLATEGLCERRSSGGAVYLVFPSLQPRLTVRRCQYCHAELPIAEDVTTCPSCGGTVTAAVVRRSMAAGEAFAMDDEEPGAKPS
jgi:hypothetical protein